MTTKKAIRKIIASALDLDPRRIRIDGDISPEFVPKNHEDISQGLVEKECSQVYGYSKANGLKRLSISRDFLYRTDEGGDQHYGESITDYLERTGESYDYLLVHHCGQGNGTDWNGYAMYSIPPSLASTSYKHYVLIDTVNVSDNDINDEHVHILCKCPSSIPGALPLVSYHEFDYTDQYNHNREYPRWFTNSDWSSIKTDYSGRTQPVNYSFDEFQRQQKEAAQML